MRKSLLAVTLIVFSSYVYANAGLPMIVPSCMFFGLALPLIIGVEAIIHRLIMKNTFSAALKTQAVSNTISTLVGIPMTWILLVALQIATGGTGLIAGKWQLETPLDKMLAITWQAPWLVPYHDSFQWMVPGAMLVLLVPFYVATTIVEYIVLRGYGKMKAKSALSIVLIANTITYASLFVIALSRFLKDAPSFSA